jgi:hypothetical protein
VRRSPPICADSTMHHFYVSRGEKTRREKTRREKTRREKTRREKTRREKTGREKQRGKNREVKTGREKQGGKNSREGKTESKQEENKEGKTGGNRGMENKKQGDRIVETEWILSKESSEVISGRRSNERTRKSTSDGEWRCTRNGDDVKTNIQSNKKC